jgi:hypothetical protein
LHYWEVLQVAVHFLVLSETGDVVVAAAVVVVAAAAAVAAVVVEPTEGFQA